MPSSEKFRDCVVAQFNGELLEGGFRVTTRKMMGEYILYADGKIFGGIYDDRLLVKPVSAAKAMLPNAKKQLPYDGAKPMLRVAAEQIADKGLLARLLNAMLPELPAAKAGKKKINGDLFLLKKRRLSSRVKNDVAYFVMHASNVIPASVPESPF